MDEFKLKILVETVQNSPLEVDMQMFQSLQNTLPAHQLVKLRAAVPYSPWQSNELRTRVLELLKLTRLKSPRDFPYIREVGGNCTI